MILHQTYIAYQGLVKNRWSVLQVLLSLSEGEARRNRDKVQ